MQQAMASPGARNRLLDGIRGVAIVLVILSHGWALWPTEDLLANEWLKPWFTSGNVAVSIFFVVGAFLATNALLKQVDAGAELRPGVITARRFLRLSGQLYVLLLVVLVVTATDNASAYPEADTGRSVLRIATYTWNWFLVADPVAARPDLGHLWYLSVDFQVFLIVLVLVYLLGRHRAWLVATLAALVVGSLLWRAHVYDVSGAYRALLQTTTRMDAPLTGALAAASLPYLHSLRRVANPLLLLSTIALVPVLVLADEEAGFSRWPGAAVDVTLFVFVVTCAMTAGPWILNRTLGSAVPAFLGRRSLSLYLWHYPLFWFVSRHSADWSWQLRTLVALVATFALAEASERLVETRVQRALRSERWAELDGGLPQFVGERARRWWRAPTEDDGAATHDRPTPADETVDRSQEV